MSAVEPMTTDNSSALVPLHPVGTRVQLAHGQAGMGHIGTVMRHSDEKAYAVRMHDSNALNKWYTDSELWKTNVLAPKAMPAIGPLKVGDAVEVLLEWPRTGTIEQIGDGVPHGVLPDQAEEIGWYMPDEMRAV